MQLKKKLVAISAPSGGGKSVVARHLASKYPNMKFSISATTRGKRPLEKDGKDYFFIEKGRFQAMIVENELIEYEEIFGNFYGTLKSEVEKMLQSDSFMLFDIDVKGALSLKKAYPDDTLLIFLAPLSIDVLERRLRGRATESEEQISNRISRAKMEIEQSTAFDYVVINDALQTTFRTIEEIISKEVAL